MKIQTAHELLEEAVQKAVKLRDYHKAKSHVDFPLFPSMETVFTDPQWQKKFDRASKFNAKRALKKADEHAEAWRHYDRVASDLNILHLGLRD